MLKLHNMPMCRMEFANHHGSAHFGPLITVLRPNCDRRVGESLSNFTRRIRTLGTFCQGEEKSFLSLAKSAEVPYSSGDFGKTFAASSIAGPVGACTLGPAPEKTPRASPKVHAAGPAVSKLHAKTGTAIDEAEKVSPKPTDD